MPFVGGNTNKGVVSATPANTNSSRKVLGHASFRFLHPSNCSGKPLGTQKYAKQLTENLCRLTARERRWRAKNVTFSGLQR